MLRHMLNYIELSKVQEFSPRGTTPLSPLAALQKTKREHTANLN